MKIWIDAQLSPAIAGWIQQYFGVEYTALRDLGLRDATDKEIFFAAKDEDVIVMTKDRDFLNLLDQYGTPPKVIWITCGNTSTAFFKEILAKNLDTILKLLDDEPLVEISGER